MRFAAGWASAWHSAPWADVRTRLTPRQAWLLATTIDARASESRTATTLALQTGNIREAARRLLEHREHLGEGARLRNALWYAHERGEALEFIGADQLLAGFDGKVVLRDRRGLIEEVIQRRA